MGLQEAFLLLGCGITGVFTDGLWDYRRCFYSLAVGLQEVVLLLGFGITGGVLLLSCGIT